MKFHAQPMMHSKSILNLFIIRKPELEFVVRSVVEVFVTDGPSSRFSVGTS